ncbi:MAG TPA: histidine phosphatase family protein [Bryobacteraceae bacterium]|nr:histidine phosphatase family protein [Bryobacteraceae bacterium]
MQLWLVRHGETAWSASGKHTGTTDLPLTAVGQRRAKEIGRLLLGPRFTLVLTSPMRRARETCRVAGYGDCALVDSNLREWDYGGYEGHTTLEIQRERPGWSLWSDGTPGGESLGEVAARAQTPLDRAIASSGDVLLFGHGHFLRVLSCCWLGLPPETGRLFSLDTASVCTLGYERDTRVIIAIFCRL